MKSKIKTPTSKTLERLISRYGLNHPRTKYYLLTHNRKTEKRYYYLDIGVVML